MHPLKRADLNLFEHDAEEEILGEIPRHPIGLFFIFFTTLFLILAILAALFYGIRHQTQLLDVMGVTTTLDIGRWLTIGAVTLVFLILVGAFMAAYVYDANYIVVTDQKLVFVNQKTIFARRISQLSIGDVQDVTVDQLTILSRIFRYGTLNIETAGEQAHFVVPYTSQPHVAGKAIVEAHEKNLHKYGN
jgi:hypothetical protein